MSTKILHRSFAGGEITPELAGRLDLVKFQTGLALARNFITLPHGPAVRRSGFEFIRAAGDSTRAVRILPFTFSADQTAVLEFGHQYLRVHIDGATLLPPTAAGWVTGITYALGVLVTESGTNYYCTVAHTSGTFATDLTAGKWKAENWATTTAYVVGDLVLQSGTKYYCTTAHTSGTFATDLAAGKWYALPASGVYQIPTPFNEADLFDLHYTQSADVVTLTHPSYATRELKRLSATTWTLTPLSFVAPTNAPTTLAVIATVAEDKTKTTQKYVVTTVAPDGVTESLPSEPKAASNNLTLAGNYNTITWSAVGGNTRYNVYKLRGGIYGYIGQARPNTGAVTRSISNITRPGGGNKTVTVTTTAAHGFSNEDLVLIEGTGEPTFDGAWVITVVNSTEFTYVSVTDGNHTHTTGTASIPELQVIDDNVLPDTSQSPPEDIIALNSGTNDYPAATTYHEQRRWFAGTNDKPQVLWATRTGTESNLTSSIPSREADGMELRIASNQYNKIRHLVALSDLIAFTEGGEFRIYSDSAPAITPTSVTIKPQGYAGASNVQPVVTTGSILYVQAQGSRIRELSYSWEANSYRTTDVSIMAPHRFNGFTVRDLTYGRAPDSIAWAVRNDGVLLGMTYVPDQQVYGWHAHDTTDGAFESVCVVPEDNEDVLYAIVRRTIGGTALRYVERLHTRMFTAQEDAFYVDSGLTYSGTPVTTLSGLSHLNGKVVDILADGAVHPRRTVSAGAITLDYAASKVHVGLPMTSDLRTLPLAMEGAQAAGQGTVKNINKVHLRVSQSSVVQAGPAFNRLREYPARAVSDPYGSAPALRDGELSLTIDPSWNQDGALCVRQDLPLPLTVLSMTLEMQSGG